MHGVTRVAVRLLNTGLTRKVTDLRRGRAAMNTRGINDVFPMRIAYFIPIGSGLASGSPIASNSELGNLSGGRRNLCVGLADQLFIRPDI